MSNKKTLFLFLFFLLFGLGYVSVSTLQAENEEDRRWSIQFGNVSISEAFTQLMELTAIKIVTKAPLEYEISAKNYVNKTLEYIMADLLSDLNHVLIWQYNDDGIESLTVWVVEGVGSDDSDSSSSPSSEHPGEEGSSPDR